MKKAISDLTAAQLAELAALAALPEAQIKGLPDDLFKIVR